MDQSAERKTLGDAEQALAECTEVEAEIAELKVAWEQFFLGFERRPPTTKHEAVKKRVAALKGQFLRQTSAKFRVQSIAAKLLTYERLWDRSLKEIEAGTYRRDVFKAKLHQKKKSPAANEHPDEDLDLSDLDDDDLDSALEDAVQAVSKTVPPPALPSIAPVAPVVAPIKPVGLPTDANPVLQGLPSLTPAPAIKPVTGTRPMITPAPPAPLAARQPPAAKPPPAAAAPVARAPTAAPAPAAAGQGGLSDQKIKAIYEAYVMAKKRCGEDTRALTLDSVATTLKKQVPELMKQHNARSVEFKVVIKDGKAVLRALPKDS